jgi:bifunctional non-homologous end joining protein LigD
MAARPTRPPAEVRLTNQEKIFYPGVGFTKGDMVRYYDGVAEFILPHLARRPVTLIRFPDGVQGKSFYEKNAPRFTPGWVRTFAVPRQRSGGEINYILIENRATLLWCANLAAVELHPFLHRVPAIDRPTSLAFDFDPGEGADLLTCIEVAFRVKELLDSLGLEAFPKVTGSKGLQLYVPLNASVSYATTGPFAKAVAELLEQRHPDLVVSKMSKLLRRDRVMIDWSQNNASKTTVGVYSLRAKRDEPFVSMPVEWKELSRAQRQGRTDDLYFRPKDALARLRKRGDLFAPVLELKQRLPARFTAATTSRDKPVRTAARASLRAYARKRDFSKTAEPPAKPPGKAARSRRSPSRKEPRFVIQKHAARNLHYDFRLEYDGTLKSWAVPKGLPYALHVKRSGFEVEDHPIDYLSFEGTIPKGQYGGGTVMVWDIGTYELLSGSAAKGSMRLRLRGKKLDGEWRLYRIRTSDDGKNVWLIEKSDRPMKPISARRDDSSVLSRRSMARIAADNDAQWQSK